MFKKLRDKFSSWIKKPEEKEEKKPDKKKDKADKKKEIKKSLVKSEDKKPEIVEVKPEVDKGKESKKVEVEPGVKDESPAIEPESTIEEEPEKKKEVIKPVEEKPEVTVSVEKPEVSPIEEKSEEIIPDEPVKEKKGFFKKLFSKKEAVAEEASVDKEEPSKENIKETSPEEKLTPEPEPTPNIASEKIPAPEIIEKTKPVIVEEPSTEPEPSTELSPEPEKESGFFSKLVKRISSSELSLEHFDEAFPDLELTLLENNVALEVVDKIRDDLSKDLVGIKIKKSDIESTILTSLKNTILSVLTEPPNLLDLIKEKEGVFVIVFLGINGAGKTTSIAKLAHYLKKNDISSVLAAGDTFRAASIEQLKSHGEALGVPVVASDYGADPASVAFDAKKFAIANDKKVVLIDTAGRMYTNKNLLKELEKIVRVAEPDLKIFVGESITGNDATEQARSFNESVNIDGIVLSKADIDEKAGTILSVSHITNKPIFFLGTGQKYDDLSPFSKSVVLKNLGLE